MNSGLSPFNAFEMINPYNSRTKLLLNHLIIHKNVSIKGFIFKCQSCINIHGSDRAITVFADFPALNFTNLSAGLTAKLLLFYFYFSYPRLRITFINQIISLKMAHEILRNLATHLSIKIVTYMQSSLEKQNPTNWYWCQFYNTVCSALLFQCTS